MANVFNSDFKDFIDALNRAGVAYLLVGGYAVILHGYSRTTGDLDIWVQPTSENYQLLELAFADFGMPTFDMTEANFLAPDKFDVFTFGVPPSAIDLMTRVKGLVFEEVYAQSSIYEFEDLAVRVINHRDLIAAKLAAGRYRDLNDVEQLRKIEEE
ncbi:hypothetical protein H9S92_01265 [Lewinella lacunae]|uniref:Nucleotidyltransferase n=2 Tax=Neolewinella lacunae TaxID=1517758 RepID=A0A923PKB2_9BACT|nr:hypothetical protein [Neolewinella lacunae]